MSLPTNTVQKLIAENFPKEEPAIKVLQADQPQLVEQLIKELTALKGVHSIQKQSFFHGHKVIRSFEISLNNNELPEQYVSSYYCYPFTHQFHLAIKSEDNSLIGNFDYRSWAAITSIAALKRFCQYCYEELRKQAARKIKSEKQKSLKKQAVIASIKKIAKAQQLNFAIETDQVKVKLYIEVNTDKWVMLHVPFNHYQTLLPKLEQAILAVLELGRLGIKIKFASPPRYNVTYYNVNELD